MAQVLEDRRIPTHEELKGLFASYFEGPITDVHVARLLVELEQVRSNPSRLAGDRGAFLPEHRHGRGFGWREEFSYGRRSPRAVDHALFLAATTRGYPKAKLYCPPYFVGTWNQVDPASPSAEPWRWTLGSDGTLASTHPIWHEGAEWCVQRTEHAGTFLGSSLCVRSPVSGWEYLVLQRASETTMSLTWPGLDGPQRYEFERSSEPLATSPVPESDEGGR